MALDRTWFNNLVDDDGSNTVGTVWNKTQIAYLLNSIDAALFQIAPTAAEWTPSITGTTGGTGQGYAVRVGSYHRIGQLVHAYCYVGLNLKGTLSGPIQVTGLPFVHQNTTAYAISTVWAIGLATTWSYLVAYVAPNTSSILIMGNQTPITATNANLQPTDLTDNTHFMLNVCYRTAP